MKWTLSFCYWYQKRETPAWALVELTRQKFLVLTDDKVKTRISFSNIGWPRTTGWFVSEERFALSKVTIWGKNQRSWILTPHPYFYFAPRKSVKTWISLVTNSVTFVSGVHFVVVDSVALLVMGDHDGLLISPKRSIKPATTDLVFKFIVLS